MAKALQSLCHSSSKRSCAPLTTVEAALVRGSGRGAAFSGSVAVTGPFEAPEPRNERGAPLSPGPVPNLGGGGPFPGGPLLSRVKGGGGGCCGGGGGGADTKLKKKRQSMTGNGHEDGNSRCHNNDRLISSMGCNDGSCHDIGSLSTVLTWLVHQRTNQVSLEKLTLIPPLRRLYLGAIYRVLVCIFYLVRPLTENA